MSITKLPILGINGIYQSKFWILTTDAFFIVDSDFKIMVSLKFSITLNYFHCIWGNYKPNTESLKKPGLSHRFTFMTRLLTNPKSVLESFTERSL